MPLCSINIPLKTHFAITNNKFAQNKFKKANGQLLYNQGINRFARAIFMENMHSYIIDFLKEIKPINDFPIEVDLIFYLHKNYQYISIRNGEVKFPKKKDVIVSFDVDNISGIWKKAIQDALTLSNVIMDDNAWLLRKTSEEVVFISTEEQMSIDIIINKYLKNN